MPHEDPPKASPQDTEFTRKMVLGILGTLEAKGLLSQAEVDSIIRAARQPAAAPAVPRRAGPALPGTRWVDASGKGLEVDRTTPVAIPDVRRRDAPETDPVGQKPPVIDMNLD